MIQVVCCMISAENAEAVNAVNGFTERGVKMVSNGLLYQMNTFKDSSDFQETLLEHSKSLSQRLSKEQEITVIKGSVCKCFLLK